MPKSAAGEDTEPPAAVIRRAGFTGILRRAFDIACTAAGLVILSPLLVLISVAIKLADSGPVLYLHQRVGRDFKPFMLLKFRTMVVNADRDSSITCNQDKRVTRIGGFLRKSKLDELPQLLNVLRGDMQLVGPRPEVARYVEMFRAEYLVLLRERPGITDPSSIAYRNEEKLLPSEDLERHYVTEILPRKLRLSLQYAAHRTFGSDLKIILRTLVPRKHS